MMLNLMIAGIGLWKRLELQDDMSPFITINLENSPSPLSLAMVMISTDCQLNVMWHHHVNKRLGVLIMYLLHPVKAG